MKRSLAKKNIKRISKMGIFVLAFVAPLVLFSKYTTTISTTITVNVREPNYTVIFHSNDGNNSTATQSFTYGVSQNLTSNSFVYSGYVFKNWNTEANGSGTSYENGQSVSSLTSIDGGTFDLYAQWAPGFLVTGNPSNWTNQNVTLTIVLTSGNYSDYDYSFDDGNTWSSNYSAVFSSNQDVYIKIRDRSGYTSEAQVESITKIDKTAPTITYSESTEYAADHTALQVTTLIATLYENTSITTGVNASDNLSGVASGWPKCYRNGSEITSTNAFTDVGRYEITCKAQDNAGNETTSTREVLIRWPLAGKYVVAKTTLDGAGIAGVGHSSSTSPNGLYQDTSDTGHTGVIPFSSKYYYTGATVDNYLSFAGKTFRILNVATNDDIKLLGNISDKSTSWSSSKIFESNVYNTWSTKWWVRGQIYNNEEGETNYMVFSDTEKAHVDLATFYAGRVEKSDDITDVVYNEQTNATNIGGASAAFQGYSAYPNASDFLKASKCHDVINSIDDIDTASVQSRRRLFSDNSWVDMTAEFWTMNGRTGTLLQNDDFWVIDNDLGGHFESRLYYNTQQYRVVFYITNTTILSGDGSSGSPYAVEEDWAWFDSYQVLQ